MGYSLAYFDEVESDIIDAKAWYKSKKEGLEESFAMAVEQALSNLQKTPTAYAIRYKNVRIAYPAIFPYAIHFYIDSPTNTIVIIAIVYAGRDQNFVIERL
jgi:ParE toxin of type II toxin-antitoxin system, parDE